MSRLVERWGGWLLAAAIVVGLAARAGVALWLPPEPTFGDGRRYDRIARSVAFEGTFGKNERVAPLHPLVMGALYRVTGPNITGARLLTALIGAAACGAGYLLGRVMFSRAVGLTAAGMLALYPLHVFTGGLFEYPTTLFILLLTLATACTVLVRQQPERWGLWIGAGALWGLACLTVPTALTAAAAVCAWMLVVCPLPRRQRLVRVGVMGVSVAVVVLSWSAYWYGLTGQFRLVADNASENFYKGNCRLTYEFGNADISEIFRLRGIRPEQIPAFAEYDAVQRHAKSLPAGPEREQVYKDAALAFIREHPAEAVTLVGRKALLFWLPYAAPVTPHQARTDYAQLAQTVTFLPVLLLAGYGAVIFRDRWRDLTFIYLIIGTQWMSYTITIVSARYRSQTDALLVVMASAVLVAAGLSIAGSLRARREKARQLDRMQPAQSHRSAGVM